MPAELLQRFAFYRFVATAIVFAQYLALHYTRPSKYSVYHGYFFSLVVGGVIVLMTRDLGGFNAAYYAGLNLVLIAVNLLLPWHWINSLINCLVIIFLYVVVNLVWPHPFEVSLLVNNLYFLSATAVIAVSINWVKHSLIIKEFEGRNALKSARDALWGEMSVAKHIQTGLLPETHRVPGYDVGAVMIPADEVGGDYYDVIQTEAGETWVTIGDVSGHGVESGLIMMMTQTAIFTTVNQTAGLSPSTVLRIVNSVIKENIERLGTDRYMTISVIRLDHDKITFAGKHQDILIRRKGRKMVEMVPSKGTWIGVMDEIRDHVSDTTVHINEGDSFLLFTDGVTEAGDESGEMFGELRLEKTYRAAPDDPVATVDVLLDEVMGHMSEQKDDVTLVAVRRRDG